MSRIFRDADVRTDALAGETVGVIGFGNQGAAQALCLRDSGLDVRVFTRPSSESRVRASSAAFREAPLTEIAECGALAVLVPDLAQSDVLRTSVHAYARPGALVVFAHGFALRDGGATVRDDLDAVLVGPLGPGALLRERFVAGSGIPALFAVVQDATGRAESRGLAYASAIGSTRRGLLATTLEEEVVSDLFAEQVVLTGGVMELMRSAWEVLVEGGVSEEVAYYSCVQELKQMLDLVFERGLAGMRAGISGTAQYGGLTRGPRIVGPEAREEMRRILREVVQGSFAREWHEEVAAGSPRLEELRARERNHPIEAAGRRVREDLGGVDTAGGEL
jgi:ketol-acid reductoisomerase